MCERRGTSRTERIGEAIRRLLDEGFGGRTCDTGGLLDGDDAHDGAGGPSSRLQPAPRPRRF